MQRWEAAAVHPLCDALDDALHWTIATGAAPPTFACAAPRPPLCPAVPSPPPSTPLTPPAVLLQRPDLPALPPNARYVYHPNSCYDWGTIGWVFSSGAADPSHYEFFLLMNSSVRGPYLPPYFATMAATAAAGGATQPPHPPPRWHDIFFDRLTDHVKLVGPTIRCVCVCVWWGWGWGWGELAHPSAHPTLPLAPAPCPALSLQLRGVALAGQRGWSVAHQPARAVVRAGHRQGQPARPPARLYVVCVCGAVVVLCDADATAVPGGGSWALSICTSLPSFP